MIADNILSRVKKEGFSNVLLESIISWKKDGSEVDKADKYIVTSNSQSRLSKMT